nr:serine--tRNA ligase [Chloroflexota bacterium]
MSVGLQRLREDAVGLRDGAAAKGEDPAVVDAAVALDERRRALLGESDGLKAERNVASKRIGERIRDGVDARGAEVTALRTASTTLGERIDRLATELATVERDLEECLLRIPNPPDPGVPVGGEEASVIVRTWGEPASHADGWTRRPHWEVADGLGMFDLAAGSKVTGSGWPIYRGHGAALQRA